MKKRLLFFLTFLLLFLIETLIALFVRDRIIRPYVGDILIVILLYCLIRTAIPDRIPLLPLFLFLFAAGVEVLQYFDFVTQIGLGDNALARLLFGTSFSVIDLFCYLIGALLCALFEFIRRK